MSRHPGARLTTAERDALIAALIDAPATPILTVARNRGVSRATAYAYRLRLDRNGGAAPVRPTTLRPDAFHCFRCTCGREVVQSRASTSPFCSMCRAGLVAATLRVRRTLRLVAA